MRDKWKWWKTLWRCHLHERMLSIKEMKSRCGSRTASSCDRYVPSILSTCSSKIRENAVKLWPCYISYTYEFIYVLSFLFLFAFWDFFATVIQVQTFQNSLGRSCCPEAWILIDRWWARSLLHLCACQAFNRSTDQPCGRWHSSSSWSSSSSLLDLSFSSLLHSTLFCFIMLQIFSISHDPLHETKQDKCNCKCNTTCLNMNASERKLRETKL